MFVLGIDNIIHDVLATIVWMELLGYQPIMIRWRGMNVSLTSGIWNLILNLKVLRINKNPNAKRMQIEIFIRWLNLQNFMAGIIQPLRMFKALEELFGEDCKEVKQVRIAIVMLWGKAKVWWGQVKANHKAHDQPPMNTWA